jgi:4-hydroxybenzoate polyprenyltransferase
MWLSYLKTLRPLNLLIMVATMILAKLFVAQPVFDLYRQDNGLSWLQFALMALATIMIAAAGYWLNDQQDVEADRINKPGKNLVGTSLNSQKVMKGALWLTLLGVILGNALAIWLGAYRLGFFYTVPAILLWFYNAKLKHWPVIGNIVVSLLVGLVPMLPGIHEMAMLNQGDVMGAALFGYIAKGTLAYGLLAFGINLIREVVKDIEDMQGDDHIGSHTLPLVIGERQTKFIAIILMLGLIRVILTGQQAYLAGQELTLPIYLAAAVQLPLLVAMVMQTTTDSMPV